MIFFQRLTNNDVILYFDIDEDWDMIVISFASEYGIRLKQVSDEEMNYDEFLQLVYGLLSIDCLFGRVVNIRSTPSDKAGDLDENDKKIWVEWRQKHKECVTHTKKITLQDIFGDGV